jgi:hypothetical protein
MSTQKTTSRIDHILVKAYLKSGNFVVAYNKKCHSKYAIPTLVGKVGFFLLLTEKKGHLQSPGPLIGYREMSTPGTPRANPIPLDCITSSPPVTTRGSKMTFLLAGSVANELNQLSPSVDPYR